MKCKKRKGKKIHLTIKEILKIEILLKENKTIKEIANIIYVSYHRIFREINNRKILFKNTKRINLKLVKYSTVFYN